MTWKFAIRLLMRICLAVCFWLCLEITEFNLIITLPNISDTVAQTAQQVTVRIFTDDSAGSGVIIHHEQQTYTVLTNRHVVENQQPNAYTVLTNDGVIHPAQWIEPDKFADLDVALLSFKSYRDYRVVKYRKNGQLWAGLIFYAAGFPNWQWYDKNTIEDTRNWGLKAFHLTTGRLAMQLDRPLEAGYQLGYTNNIESGMSGGPILDVWGYLVGINGRLKYPLGGIETFRFMDGTLPSWSKFKQMERLSWGIPIYPP